MDVLLQILLVFKVFCYIIIEKKGKNVLLVKTSNTFIGIHLNKVMLDFCVTLLFNIPQFAPLAASIYQTPQQS